MSTRNASIVIAMIATATVGGCVKAPPAPSPEDIVTAKAITAVKDVLRDPESASFRNISAESIGHCAFGEVNAKNAYGGYTGFTGFVWYHDKVTMDRGGQFGDIDFELTRNDCSIDSIDRSGLQSSDPALRKATADAIASAESFRAKLPKLKSDVEKSEEKYQKAIGAFP